MNTTRFSITLAAVLAATLTASGALITDYFEYGGANGLLTSFTTANTEGWDANGWSGDDLPEYFGANVSLRYNPVYAGENVSYSNWLQGGVVHASNVIGTVSRAFDSPLSGTVWVSLVMSSSWWNAALSSGYPDSANGCRFLINGNTANAFGATASAVASKRRWLVVENGTLTTNDIVAGSAAIQDHTVLLVARLRTDYSGSADDITLWLFSTNMVYPNARSVAGLGPEVYTSSVAQDLWGSSLDGIWLRLKSQNSANRDFYVDSLRVSYGAALSDDDMVYEIMTGVAVPEPALLGVLGAGLVLAARRRM